MRPEERIIIALDVDSDEQAEMISRELAAYVGAFKIGKELFTACGPSAVTRIKAQDGNVFLDLKFHDIPNTVRGAAREAAKLGVFMFTVHASGGAEMIRAACEGACEGSNGSVGKPLVIAVTVLTSISEDILRNELRIPFSPSDQVAFWASLAQKNGADGVVCSPHEIEAVRETCGKDFLIVTPGIRPAWAVQGDQKRVSPPGGALRKGADYLVIGRPVTRAEDRIEAARLIAEELGGSD